MKARDEHSHNFIRHAGIYLIARGLPGIFAFLSIPLFTRLLDPARYGKYALVMSSVNLINAIFLSWLALGLVRFLPAHRHAPARLKSTLLSTAGLLVALAGLAAISVYLVPAWRPWYPVAVVAFGVLLAQTPYDLFCEFTRSQIMPWRFMSLQFTRSLVATLLGALLIRAGAGWWGPLAGLMVGMAIPVAYTWRRDWSDVRPIIDREMLAQICRYAIPVSITFTLAVVISSSDRFLIAWFKGEDAAGLYSVAVDLTNRSLFLLMNVVNMAMYPLAVRAFEDRGREAAQEQMRHNASLLMAVGIPCVVAMGLLAGSIAHSILGESFRATASGIIPLVALGAFLAGFKAFHWDAAFQFAHATIHQVWIVLIVAVINIGLNLAFVPRLGINGAAMASVLAYIVSISMTAIIGRRYFSLPMPLRPLLQVILATAAMALVLYPLRQYRGLGALTAQSALGAAAYLTILVGQNFLDLRTSLVKRLLPVRVQLQEINAPDESEVFPQDAAHDTEQAEVAEAALSQV
jgi:O-antigen/teichoic acid export membrane protein